MMAGGDEQVDQPVRRPPHQADDPGPVNCDVENRRPREPRVNLIRFPAGGPIELDVLTHRPLRPLVRIEAGKGLTDQGCRRTRVLTPVRADPDHVPGQDGMRT